MRVLALIGALAFLYLAIIPAGLIHSTVDSACAGEGCATSTISRVGFTTLYGLCLAALLTSAGLFVAHAVRNTHASQERLLRGLANTGAIVGGALFALFAVAFPLGAAVAFALAAPAYVAIRRGHPARRPEPPLTAAVNGHGPNGAHGHGRAGADGPWLRH